MSVAADTAITRWAEIMEGTTTKQPLRASNVFVEGERVFSYGYHFELARPLRDKRRRVHAYLLNGDRYSNTTTGHQSSVRRALSTSKAPQVIIPYTALDAAGVDRNSIRLVHVLPDRWETRHHRTTELPQGFVSRTEPVYMQKLRPLEDVKAHLMRSGYIGHYTPETAPEWMKYDRVQVGTEEVLYPNRFSSDRITVTWHDGANPTYTWETHHHRLGESLIKARIDWTDLVRCEDCHGLGRGPRTDTWAGVCPTCNGRGTRARWHHRWTLFLSGFDHQEPNPLYFLCELPYHCGATTVEEAYEALKPVPVKLAEQMGRSYTRQGDIFALPVPSMTDQQLKAMGARIEKRSPRNSPRPTHYPHILGTNHTASQVAYLPGVTLAKGLLYHDPGFREQDHVRRKMGDGKTWHVVVKNTVPTSTRR